MNAFFICIPWMNYFFPNPSRGTISWKGDLLRKIDIYSIQGNLVQTILPDRSTNSAEVNVSADGIYLIKAWDGKRSVSQKMLILK